MNIQRNGENIINYELILPIAYTLKGKLIAFETDPESQKAKLYDIVTSLQDYLLLVTTEVIPNLEDIQSKSYMYKGDIPQVKPCHSLKLRSLK